MACLLFHPLDVEVSPQPGGGFHTIAPFGKQNLRSFGGVFDRTCVRPHDVASVTPRAGMLFGKPGSHRFRELHALEPRV